MTEKKCYRCGEDDPSQLSIKKRDRKGCPVYMCRADRRADYNRLNGKVYAS